MQCFNSFWKLNNKGTPCTTDVLFSWTRTGVGNVSSACESTVLLLKCRRGLLRCNLRAATNNKNKVFLKFNCIHFCIKFFLFYTLPKLYFRVLLQGADIVLAYGRRYGFVGRNGLGKTTLLRMISSGQLRIPSHISILHVEQEVCMNIY